MAVNVAHFLAQQAKALPGDAAVRAPDGHLANGSIRYLERSFLELEQEASATAYYLADSGVQRGTRVLLMVKPGLDLIQLFSRCLKLVPCRW